MAMIPRRGDVHSRKSAAAATLAAFMMVGVFTSQGCSATAGLNSPANSNANFPNSTVTADSTQVAADGSATVNITVTVKDANGTLVTNANVLLLVDDCYVTAAPPSQGVYTFTLSSTRAGQRSISAYVSAGALSAVLSSQVTVNFAAAPAQGLQLNLLAAAPAGQALDVTVTAYGKNGAVDTGYAGTLHFTASDANAHVPGDYQFAAADKGRKVFAGGATYVLGGSQTLTVTDDTQVSQKATVQINTWPLIVAYNNTLCLDTDQQALTVGAALVTSPCDGAASQQMLFTDVHLVVGGVLCVASEGTSALNSPITLAACDLDATNQLWYYDVANDAIRQANTGLFMANNGSNPATLSELGDSSVFRSPQGMPLRSGAQIGMCVDTPMGQHINHAAVQLVACSASSAADWVLVNNQVRTTDGFCLETIGGNLTPGAGLQMTPCSDTLGQYWAYDTVTLQLMKAENPSKCVALAQLPAANATSSIPLTVADCLPPTDINFATQVWMQTGPLHTSDSMHCLDTANGSLAVNTPVQLGPCNGDGTGNATQQWQFVNAQLRTLNNMCLNTGTAGTALTLQTCDLTQGAPAWLYDPLRRTIRIPNSSPQLCVDTQGATSNGAPVLIEDCQDVDSNQVWQ